MTEPIAAFRGPYAFLSNFHPAPVFYCKQSYPTVEHAYQAAKVGGKDVAHARASIRAARSPGVAKRLGRTVTIRADWETARLTVMQNLLQQKFGRHVHLRNKLLATLPHELIETNNWNDHFWGVCNGCGQNHLGRLLMEVRTNLEEEEIVEC